MKQTCDEGSPTGFSLIEMLFVLLIIGLLGVLAFPTYQNHLRQSRRVDGQSALMHLLSEVEAFFTEHQTYRGAPGHGRNLPYASSQGHYDITVSHATPSTWTLTAHAIGDQAQDAAWDHDAGEWISCETLTINQFQQKKPAACWP